MVAMQKLQQTTKLVMTQKATMMQREKQKLLPNLLAKSKK